MTCPQLLRHSLACTARQRPSARRRRLTVGTSKGKRIPWRAERVQHSLSLMNRPIPALPFIRDAPLPIPHELHLTIPNWAHNPLRLQQLFVFNVTTKGIFASTVPSTSVLTANNVPQATPNIVALATTVLFANASATSHVSVPTGDAPFVMTQSMSSATVLSQRTPVRGLSSTRETLRDCDLVLVVRVFDGGIVMVRNPDLLFSIIHFAPLATDSPLTFTLTVSFFTDVYQYTIQ